MEFLVVGGIYSNIEEVPPGGNQIIVEDLKTLRGVINRFKKWYPFRECTIFTYTDIFNDSTFKQLYAGVK